MLTPYASTGQPHHQKACLALNIHPHSAEWRGHGLETAIESANSPAGLTAGYSFEESMQESHAESSRGEERGERRELPNITNNTIM